MGLLVTLLLALLVQHSIADDPILVNTAAELRQALSTQQAGKTTVIHIMQRLYFSSTEWTADPARIWTSVFLFSPHRSMWTFCWDDACKRGTVAGPYLVVTSTGSLRVERCFFNGFMPPDSPVARAAVAHAPGATPFIASSGGPITYVLVVWHMRATGMWVFDVHNTFWSTAESTPLQFFRVEDYGALDRLNPALYSVKRVAFNGSTIQDSYAPFDINPTPCYDSDDASTTLIYCPYTFGDSLRNPYISSVVVFHNVGLDRAAYNWMTPSYVHKSVQYRPCPGFNITINFDQVVKAVVVDGVTVSFTDLSLEEAPAVMGSDPSWPQVPGLMPHTFVLQGAGRVDMLNCTLRLPAVSYVLSMLAGLPTGRSDITVPALRPDFAPVGPGVVLPGIGFTPAANVSSFVISSWVVSRRSYLTYILRDVLTLAERYGASLESMYTYRNVTIQPYNGGIYQGAINQGSLHMDEILKVSTSAQLRAALVSPSVRYVQIVADITLSPADGWSSGANAVVLSRLLEVRAIHPIPGVRYTLDFAGLVGVVRVSARLALQGDLRLSGLGWAVQSVTSPNFVIIPAIEPYRVPNALPGLLELQGVLIDDGATALGRSSQILAALGLGSGDDSLINTTISLAARPAPGVTGDKSRITLGILSAPTLTQGNYAFINSYLCWNESGPAVVPEQPVEEGSSTHAAAIAVPVALGSTALIAAAIAVYMWRARRRASSMSGSESDVPPGLNKKLAALAGAVANHSSSSEDPETGRTRTSSTDHVLKRASGASATSHSGAVATVLNSSAGNNTVGSAGHVGNASGSAPHSSSRLGQHTGCVDVAHEHPPSRGAPITPAEALPSSSRPSCTLSAAGTHSDGGAAVLVHGAAGPPAEHVYFMQAHSLHVANSVVPADGIDQARHSLMAAAAGTRAQHDETVTLLSVLGEGTYGRVYKANWKGIIVAVKVIVLPSAMSGTEKREKMAVMETAISSSLSHPNIVQTYTFSVEPVRGKAAGIQLQGMPPDSQLLLHASGGAVLEEGADVTSWEVRLVQEYCEAGSLRELLDRHTFFMPAEAGAPAGSGAHATWRTHSATVDLEAVLDTALDVARAMEHLHAQQIVHADLKPRNILLKANPLSRRGFVAKVADFGLSVRIGTDDTHVSNACQGTMSHMAPETLMYARIGKPVDVYAFGITLWELYTGERAFKGVPKVLLGHAITQEHSRPMFPHDTPPALRDLAERCWAADPATRPTFTQALAELKAIRHSLLGAEDEASSITLGQHAQGLLASHPTLPTGPQPHLSTATSTIETALVAQALPNLLHEQSDVAAGHTSPWAVAARDPGGMPPMHIVMMAASTSPSSAHPSSPGTGPVVQGAYSADVASNADALLPAGKPADSAALHGPSPPGQPPQPVLANTAGRPSRPSHSLSRSTPSQLQPTKRTMSNTTDSSMDVSLGLGGVVRASAAYQAVAEAAVRQAGEVVAYPAAADPDQKSQSSFYLEHTSTSCDVPLAAQLVAAAALRSVSATNGSSAASAAQPMATHQVRSLLNECVMESSLEGLNTSKLVHKMGAGDGAGCGPASDVGGASGVSALMVAARASSVSTA